MRQFICIDCGSDDLDCPMIKDELWISIGNNERTLMCLNCFEKRIGRLIKIEDFRSCKWTRHLIRFMDRARQGLI